MRAQKNAGFLPIQNIADFKCRLNTCVQILSPELATPQMWLLQMLRAEVVEP